MKIAHLIFFGFLFVLILFSLTTWMNYQQMEAVKENTEFVSHSATVVRQSNRFQRNILNIVSGLRAYFLTGDSSFIQAFNSAQQENEGILTELTSAADSAQRPGLRRIQALNDRWTSEFVKILGDVQRTAVSSRDPVDLSFVYKNEFPIIAKGDVAEDLQAEVRNFINEEYKRREVRKKQLAESIVSTRRLSFLLTFCSIVTGILIAGFMTYNISRRIMRLVNMSNTIAEGNYKVQVEPGRDELGRLAISLNHMARVLDTNISELKRKNGELDQFAHIVSHDLKSPLRGIGNVIEWIEEDHGVELSPKVQEYFGLIKGRLARAENLISGILSYARVGKEETGSESVVLRDLLQEIIENLAPRPGTELLISPELPTLYAERLPLYQVFDNLISNAFKYNDKLRPQLAVWHEEQPDHYVFFVQDNGPGISEAYHQKIFQIFQTLQSSEVHNSTGVGLAIVKKILDARHESVQLQSEQGLGTTFSFTWKKQTEWKK
ncbi:MAG: HAMP domain-containing protein [Chitinophagaceae bacterium]|nr:MAG: HAMP domain-containing protein [Chitinophagaceae bacterium]